MLTYPAVWRFYRYVKTLFEEYEKVIICATDAYILSQRLADYIEGLDSGWTALWTPKYNYPETSIQVIVRGCKEFEEFDFNAAENRCVEEWVPEEMIVPLTHVEKGFVGDRFSEYAPDEPVPSRESWDYYCQIPDEPYFNDSLLPVLRRVDGKIVVEPL